jgi:iron(III) transport system substrate-binding protein
MTRERHLKTFRFRSIAAVALVALTLGACGTSSSSEPEDTSLTVYSGRSEELVKDLYAAFTAETGITVNARYGDSGEMAALILTEGSSSPADVYFSQDAGALGAVEGILEKLPQNILSAVGSQYSAASGKWVGVSGRVRVVVYNPTLVPTPPTTIDELLDKKWSGKIGFAPNNASWQSFVTALRVLRGEDEAEKWLIGFAANKPVAYEKNGVVRDAVNAGEVSLGLVNHYYLYEKIAAEGANKIVAKNQYMAPGDVGGLINVAGVGILSSAPHKSAAKKFVEFLQSETANEYFRTKTWEYLLSNDATQPEGLPSLSELKAPSFDLSNLKSIEATQELLQKVGLLTK